MDFSAIALQGLEQAQTQFENVATALASAGTTAGGGNVDVVDLSAEIVAMMAAKTDFSISLSVLKTASQVEKQVTDILA